MVFTDVRLQNYRSYLDSSFDLDGGVTIIVGPNGAGKSNLIEAILLVSTGSVYRAKENIVNHGADWARIDIHDTQNTLRTVKITKDQDKEKPALEFLINKKTYKRLPNTQKQPAVLFEPGVLALMHGSPQTRRDYMDNFSAQMSEVFAAALPRYKRALAQRNALLKKPTLDERQLFVWNIRLSELADTITRQRIATLKLIDGRLSEVYSKISNKKTGLEIKYATPSGTQNYSANLLKKLEADIGVDRARGFTGSGPHREDFIAEISAKPVSTTASRGETRTLLLALKVIELELLEDKTKVKPILLLDDVFSELDNSRRKALTGFLKKYQTIITTTDADIILKNFSQDCQIIPL